jgi:hypothetical protein
MGVCLVVAVTDGDWFDHLRRKGDLSEVNFCAPSSATFKALQPGELFLFKLHAPRNFIVGGGVSAHSNALPCSLSWEASNGILMRRDIHSLFDAGYVTVTPELIFEVSRRIRDEFENGREYYDLHGGAIATPDDRAYMPDTSALAWHNNNVFRG